VRLRENSSELDKLLEIGAEIHRNYNLATLNEVVDQVCAKMALRLVDVAVEQGLVLKNSSIGFTGRAAISGENRSIFSRASLNEIS